MLSPRNTHLSEQQTIDNAQQTCATDGIDDFEDAKPAIFVARKLFSDFVQYASKTIETTLAEEGKHKSIYSQLERDVDVTYDQILEALGSISEFCLPSLLRSLLLWYEHQLSIADTEFNSHRLKQQQQQQQASSTAQSLPVNIPSSIDTHQLMSSYEQSSIDCGSPGNESLLLASNNSSLVRSPTPISSPDNGLTIQTPFDFQTQQQQSPSMSSNPISPLAATNSSSNNPNQNVTLDQNTSSAANTSTSTATNASSTSLIEQNQQQHQQQQQQQPQQPQQQLQNDNSINMAKKLELVRKRRQLIEFALCQALFELLQQLHLHPGQESLIDQVVDIMFEHFRYGEMIDMSATELADAQILADKFANVLGLLARTRFRVIRERFISELNELRGKEPTPFNIQCVVTLLSGLRYFRVKMAPIEEFEASFQFLQELGDYFLDTRLKSIRHALANLFVEITVPLASIVKNEVKIPCMKNFVEQLWAPTLDMCTRKKHSITLYPLVTCLLCLSQRAFFLSNWGNFLSLCLSNLKNRDQKMCRIALESLYRLVWIYMIRVKCESNNITQARLQSIVDALFPRSSRSVIPRDAPINVFVDIIQFIAQERLDFAMRHIIFDLMSVDRPVKVVTAPERMNIAIQAFLVIIDSLQLKDGEPEMPQKVGSASSAILSPILEPSASSSPQQQQQQQHGSQHYAAYHRRSQGAISSKLLNEDMAKSIGIYPYYPQIQRAFNDIIRALDSQFGRPLLLTTLAQGAHANQHKDLSDLIGGDRRSKIELLRTCVAAIPRILPDGMTRQELVDFLSRMTVHLDEQVRRLALESLQILIVECADWRLDAIEGFTSFLVNQIDESLRHIVDNSLRVLLQFLVHWRTTISAGSPSCAGNAAATAGKCATDSTSMWRSSVSIQTGYETISSRQSSAGGQVAARKNRALTEMRLIQTELSNTRFDRLVSVIQKVEGASLVMLCSCHQPTRRLAAHLLCECRTILKCYSSWTCMEQFGFRSPDDMCASNSNAACGGGGDEEDLSTSLRGSISADNLSRITAMSANGALYNYSSATSVSKMCMTKNDHNTAVCNTTTTHSHDPYDSDIDTDLTECFTGDERTTTGLIFWASVIMLDSDNDNEREHKLGLKLLKRVLPSLPIEHADFLDELDKQLEHMGWHDFAGLQAIVLARGLVLASSYDTAVALLDHLTPILTHSISCGRARQHANKCGYVFVLHVIALLTHLLLNYDDPNSFSLNIARRIALWCDENGNAHKLEDLAAVMNLYSRRSFSKDAFQWTKCVVKYLHDAYSHALAHTVPLLVQLLHTGPAAVQRVVPAILYCIFNYLDLSDVEDSHEVCLSAQLSRLYAHQLAQCATGQPWRDATQIFKLIIARSSQLPATTQHRRELPGRTLDFSVDIDKLPVIARTKLVELNVISGGGGGGGGSGGGAPDQLLSLQIAPADAADGAADAPLAVEDEANTLRSHSQKQQQQRQDADSTVKWRKSCLANRQVRERLVSLLMS